MAEPRKIIDGEGSGFFQGIANHLKLVWLLWQDMRVNPLLKMLPFGSILYLISPLDIAIPVVDDIGVIWFFTYLFIELCPEVIVEEHKAAIQQTINLKWRDEEKPEIDEEDIVDAEYKEKETDT